MRFFDTSKEPLSIEAIQEGLRKEDPAYRLEIPESAKIPQADLYLGEGLYAEIEINQPDQGLFHDEIREMLEFLEASDGKNRERVESVLRSAERIISVRVLYQDRELNDTLAGIDPLWRWLFATRKGLLQADGDGYFDEDGLVLEEGW